MFDTVYFCFRFIHSRLKAVFFRCLVRLPLSSRRSLSFFVVHLFVCLFHLNAVNFVYIIFAVFVFLIIFVYFSWISFHSYYPSQAPFTELFLLYFLWFSFSYIVVVAAICFYRSHFLSFLCFRNPPFQTKQKSEKQNSKITSNFLSAYFVLSSKF